MKVQQINKNTFTPIALEIVIESQEELEALKDMLHYNATIPNLVKEDKKEIIESFMECLIDSLR